MPVRHYFVGLQDAKENAVMKSVPCFASPSRKPLAVTTRENIVVASSSSAETDDMVNSLDLPHQQLAMSFSAVF